MKWIRRNKERREPDPEPPSPMDDPACAQRAKALRDSAIRLMESGHQSEALAAGEQAVALYRELIAGDLHTYLPELATSVNDHGNQLAETDRRAEALDFSLEAVDLYRELAAGDQATWLPYLALSLWDVGLVALTVGVVSGEIIDLVAESARYFEGLGPDSYDQQHHAALRTLDLLREAADAADREEAAD